MERLHKKIANYGYCSRRDAEELILNKRVKVNDEIITELGFKVTATDVIKIDNQIINKEIVREYYLLNKPRQVISSVNDNVGRITVVDLIDTETRIYPVGRLDYDTTGLIILTNDGEFANYISHPKNEVEKTYLVKINGILSKRDLTLLKEGIKIEGRAVNIVDFKNKKKDLNENVSFLEITLYEGRNHIVKNIFKHLGYDVLKLKRIKIGHLEIDNLQSGEYRPLKIKDIKRLRTKKE